MVLTNKVFLWIVGVILLLAFFNSVLASSHPDGLERVAEDLGFIDYAKDSFSIFSDYQLPIGDGLVATGLAGLLGVGLTYMTLTLLAKGIINKKVVKQDEN